MAKSSKIAAQLIVDQLKLMLQYSFGFEDGISQPLMDGIDPIGTQEPKASNMITSVKTIVVLPGSPSNNHSDRPTWMSDGSFLVIRKLQQDVKAFNALIADHADYKFKTDEQMAAKLMGRWRSGKF
jgi:deferrochelatase/peroxidase EfeB